MHEEAHIVPPSHWPIVGCLALFCIAFGGVHWLHHSSIGPYCFGSGFLILFFMMHGWFKQVIDEGIGGLNKDATIDLSFRWGMGWFIFSEVMFFSLFFGMLFYTREVTLPFLAGTMSESEMTHFLLWPGFQDVWPLLKTPDPALYPGPNQVVPPWGLPALNTLILLTSGVTVTVAHWGILSKKRMMAIVAQILTILLGMTFLFCQATEYMEAYTEKGLQFDSGIYGNTFFILTGFHGLHVTIGTIMLCAILFRIIRGDFTPKEHFAFEGVAWYWHFVDVVWLLLFIFVYWL